MSCLHLDTLSEEEAKRHATAMYRATGVIPDIHCTEHTPKDHTTKEAKALRKLQGNSKYGKNQETRLAEDAAKIRAAKIAANPKT